MTRTFTDMFPSESIYITEIIKTSWKVDRNVDFKFYIYRSASPKGFFSSLLLKRESQEGTTVLQVSSGNTSVGLKS